MTCCGGKACRQERSRWVERRCDGCGALIPEGMTAVVAVRNVKSIHREPVVEQYCSAACRSRTNLLGTLQP